VICTPQNSKTKEVVSGMGRQEIYTQNFESETTSKIPTWKTENKMEG